VAQYQIRFQTAGNALNIAPQGPEEDLTLQTQVTFAADPEGGAAIVASIPGLSDVHLAEAWLELGAAGAGGSPINARCYGTDQWYLEAPAGAQDWFANGQASLRDVTGLQAGGPFLAQPQLVLGGAALASFAVAPTTVASMVRYSRRFAASGGGSSTAWSWQQAVAFLDDNAGESLADPTTFLRRLERSLRVNAGANFVLGLDNAGAEVSLRNCGFAAVDRRGVLWLSPSDIGVGAGQIPPQFASNTAERCKYHPAVFWPTISGAPRRLELTERADVTASAITTQAGAPVVFSIDSDVTASRWLFVVDGQAVTTTIRHGNIKRPRDVWNQVIVPAIQRNAPGQGLVMYRDETAGGVRNFFVTGILNGLSNLTHAQFLEPLGDVSTDVYTWSAQT